MSEQPGGPPPSIIRISKDDAESKHVDELLERQRNMRGETGIARSSKRAWYFQNWLIFSIVGVIGAIIAWGILEPMFDDVLWIQGTVTSMGTGEEFVDDFAKQIEVEMGDEALEAVQAELGAEGAGDDLDIRTFLAAQFGVGSMMVVNDQKIGISVQTKVVDEEQDEFPLYEEGDVAVGDEVRVYFQQIETPEGGYIGQSVFIDTNPPAISGKSATIQSAVTQYTIADKLYFPLIAGLIGMFIGAADGLSCRLPRRALLCGLVGLLAGLVGGFISSYLADVIYQWISTAAAGMYDPDTGEQSTSGFLLQVLGRSLAWMVAGMAMGLGQGIAMRSPRLLAYGFLGGLVGGLLGGLFFDPITEFMMPTDFISAHASRFVGITVIGGTVGLMIGIVELLARDAWLRMIKGPLAGKEFLLFKDTMAVGKSPRSDLYIFNDDLVADTHAVLRVSGEDYELESKQPDSPATVNGRPVKRAKLRHGDKVGIGETVFVFNKRQR